MAKFKKGDIIEWTGCVARIEHIHSDLWGEKDYILTWLFNPILETGERLAREVGITHLENNAILAPENYQILYGKV